MKCSFASGVATAAIVLTSLTCISTVTAQNPKFPAAQQKKVQRGFGPDADQTSRGEPPADVIARLKKEPTPRTADGHPDLLGLWGAAGWGYTVSYGKLSADGKTYDIENAVGLADRPSAVAAAAAARAAHPPEPPPYKPEYAAKAKDLSDHWMIHDPTFYCGLQGFPRVGPPTEIGQVAGGLIFLYQPIEELNVFRIIPTDGRKRDPIVNPSYLGQSVGHWEGDTLVIDVTDFVDTTWISREAPIHSEDMRVVEKLTREGNTIRWSATIEDPTVLTKPIVQNRTLALGLKGGHVTEELPCKEQDSAHIPVK